MIRIQKLANVPSAFSKAKLLHSTYDELYNDEKDELKGILLNEQNYLCAYCMSKINMDNSSIEHYIPRNPEEPSDNDTSLDYTNLFAVCTTSKNLPDNEKYCEAKRGNTELHINPTVQAHIDTISYNRNGNIFSSIPLFQTDIDETLNLNCLFLCRNRQSALSAFLRQMNNKKSGRWNKEYISRIISRLESRETSVPYVGYILFFLKKRLNQCG